MICYISDQQGHGNCRRRAIMFLKMILEKHSIANWEYDDYSSNVNHVLESAAIGKLRRR